MEGVSDRLSQLLSQLGDREGGEGEDGEEGLVKMMEGMMGTLLSRDVLYPSLTEICKQVHHLPAMLIVSNQHTLESIQHRKYCNPIHSIMHTLCSIQTGCHLNVAS